MSLSRFVDALPGAATAAPGTIPTESTASCATAWEFETSEATRITVCCSRRAGKTFAARRKAIRVACTQPGSWVHLISLVRRNARRHFYTGICSMLHELGWRPRAWATDMVLRLENGSFMQCIGADDESDIKRIHGDFSSLICVDESHLEKDNIARVLFAAAAPMTIDTNGSYVMLGLPPDTEPVFFSECLDNASWKNYSWNILSHDLPASAVEKKKRIDEDLRQRGLKWSDPEPQRTYLGRRVRDPSKGAYEYVSPRNDYRPADVDFDRKGWLHAVGMDQGWSDKDAVAVLAWRYDDPEQKIYVRFVWNRSHVPTGMLRKLTGAVQTVYAPVVRWTADHSGGGSQRTIDDLTEHLGIALERKPTDVAVSLGLVNDSLRTGCLLFPTSDTETHRVEAHMRRVLHGVELDEALLMLREGQVQSQLAGLIASVNKTYDPITRKLKINTQAKHVDISEAIRYGHAGVKNFLAANVPRIVKPTADELEELAERSPEQPWHLKMASRRR